MLGRLLTISYLGVFRTWSCLKEGVSQVQIPIKYEAFRPLYKAEYLYKAVLGVARRLWANQCRMPLLKSRGLVSAETICQLK
jgi:hypothetical protein